jgi:tetratricopeptide (TPR) repeat protein
MVCPKCRSNVSDKRIRCDRCGQDLVLYKKIFKASNMYYNNGLTRAKVRDLSGAVVALKKSLELNKANTDARNLLGLIYFEMGETVAALSEWVISKHFQPDNNDADNYINNIQENPTRLDNLNQAIKRYNNALVFAKQGSDDLAIIQLKRVLQLNPNFIRAYHLISLLYMKNGEKERAKKSLLKAARIDVTNTTTLRYLRELEPRPVLAKEGDMAVSDDKDVTSSIMPVSSYREDKPNVMAFVNLIVGVLIGLAVATFLILPTIKNNDTKGKNLSNDDYSAGMAVIEEKDAVIAQLQDEKDKLEETIITLRAELEGIVIPEVDPALYDPLLEASLQYIEELTKDEEERDFKQIAEKLSFLDTSMYETDASLQLVEKLKQMIYPEVSVQYYNTGHDLYSDARYEEALEDLFLSYFYNPDNYDAIYFIARAYHRLQDYDNAKIYYEIIVNDFQDTRRYDNAKSYLQRIQN